METITPEELVTPAADMYNALSSAFNEEVARHVAEGMSIERINLLAYMAVRVMLQHFDIQSMVLSASHAAVERVITAMRKTVTYEKEPKAQA